MWDRARHALCLTTLSLCFSNLAIVGMAYIVYKSTQNPHKAECRRMKGLQVWSKGEIIVTVSEYSSQRFEVARTKEAETTSECAFFSRKL